MEMYYIEPASSKPVIFLLLICAILVFVIIILANTVYSAYHSKLGLSETTLELTSGIRHRIIPVSGLQPEKAKIINLDEASDLQPVSRTFGTALPGYRSGWFRLRNREKALLYVTNRSRVVYLPTGLGYVLLLSVNDPSRFLGSIENHTGQ